MSLSLIVLPLISVLASALNKWPRLRIRPHGSGFELVLASGIFASFNITDDGFRMFETNPEVKRTFEKFREIDTPSELWHSAVLETHGMVVMNTLDEIPSNVYFRREIIRSPRSIRDHCMPLGHTGCSDTLDEIISGLDDEDENIADIIVEQGRSHARFSDDFNEQTFWVTKQYLSPTVHRCRRCRGWGGQGILPYKRYCRFLDCPSVPVSAVLGRASGKCSLAHRFRHVLQKRSKSLRYSILSLHRGIRFYIQGAAKK